MVQSNPFKPTAGRTPPLLVGRQPVIDDFQEALDDGPGAPGRLMRVTGARGIGKTVILTEFGEIAKSRKWTVVDETASPGLAQRLAERIEPHGKMDIDLESELTLPFVNVRATRKTEHSDFLSITLRDAVSKRLDEVESRDRGLLITIDEAQAASRDDMVAIATTMQHMTREGRNFAFVFAGLPTMSSKWLNDDVLTFMRRAQPEVLDSVPLDEVSNAFATTFGETEMMIGGDELRRATEATAGYPYMIQLVGYNIWRIARRNQRDAPFARVTADEVTEGIKAAVIRLGDTVHGPELDGLSPVDKTYLLAMAQDDGPSSTADIAARMGKSVAYGNIYRSRLIESQVIKNAGHGYVDFAIPGMREYLREHAAYYRLTTGEAADADDVDAA